LHRRGLSACPKSGDYKEAPPDQARKFLARERAHTN
jgi:hypothetical protein